MVDLERRHELSAHAKRQLRSQRLFVRDTSDAVGTEQTRHRELISWTRLTRWGTPSIIGCPLPAECVRRRAPCRASRPRRGRGSGKPRSTPPRQSAASEPARRSSGRDRPMIAPRKDFRDTPTQSGRPSASSSPSPASTVASHSSQASRFGPEEPDPWIEHDSVVGNPGSPGALRAPPSEASSPRPRARARTEHSSGNAIRMAPAPRSRIRPGDLGVAETGDVVDHAGAGVERGTSRARRGRCRPRSEPVPWRPAPRPRAPGAHARRRSLTVDAPYGAVERAPTSISDAPASTMASAAATRSGLRCGRSRRERTRGSR